jgi:peptidoglycan/xylan/chitin deacetylase (PgdA/CDA1 family)
LKYRTTIYQITCILGFIISNIASFSQTSINLNCQPTTWADNKSSALSFTFDDGYANQFIKAVPLLNKRNFKATFYVISGYVDSSYQGVTWDTIRKAASYGHEIASHTVNHAALVDLSYYRKYDSIKQELLISKNKIDSNIRSQKCLTLAYPWAWHNKVVDSLTAKYYLAGRTAGFFEDKNPVNFFGLTGSIIYPNLKISDINGMFDNSKMWGSWFIEIWHGIDSGGWGAIPASRFDQHLSYVKYWENQVWVAKVQDVVKYIKERQKVRFNNQFISENLLSFSVNDSLPDSVYNYPVTVKFLIPGYFNKVDSILQNGTKVKYFINSYFNWNFLYLNVLPDTSKVKVYLRDSSIIKPIITVTRKKILCYGDSVKLNAPYSYKYYWSTGDTVKYIWVKKSGKYTLTVKTNPYSHSNVSDTVFVSIPPAVYKPIISLNKPPFICKGDSVLLSAPAGFKNYFWNGIETKADIYIKNSGTYNVYLTDSLNCRTSTSDKVIVKVFSLPDTPQVSKIQGVSICDAEKIELTTTSGYQRYKWNTGDTTQQIFVGYAGKFSVYVIDSNNCRSAWSDPFTVTYLFSFYHPKILVQNNTTHCEGNPVILEAPDNYYAYKWSDGSITRILKAQKGGKYFLRVYDNNMCPSGYSDSVNVQFHAQPSKPDVIIKGKDRFCMGDSVILSSPDRYNYNTWSDNSHSPDLLVKKSGTYLLVMNDANGCVSPASDEVEIVVIDIPKTPSIILTEDLNLKSSISAESYNWKLNNELLVNNSSKINANKYGPGFYEVSVANENCTSGNSEIFAYFPKSLSIDSKSNMSIKISPSLSNGYIEVNCSEEINPRLIEVLNLSGKLLMKDEIRTHSKIVKMNIDLLKPGEYILKVTAEEGIFNQKFVLQ